MNRSILIVICDFLLLSLLTFSTDINRMADENTQSPTKVVVATNAVVNMGSDLAAVMKQALEEERRGHEQLQQQLAQARNVTRQQQAELNQRDRNLSQLQQAFAAAQTNIGNLDRQLQAKYAQAQATQQKLASVETEAQQQAEQAAALRQQLDQLNQSNAATQAEKQKLAQQLQLAEVEQRAANERAALMEQEVEAARTENARLAEGLKTLATNSSQLTQEIRDNRALAPNAIFSEFVSNRIEAAILASRPTFLGFGGDKSTTAKSILASDGTTTFALSHVEDTPLALRDPGTDWSELSGTLTGRGGSTPIRAIAFDQQDPRAVMIPLSPDEARQLGNKVYRLSSDPYKFQDAVLVGADAGYYGECNFQIDLNTPHYVKLDRSLLKGLFGQFNPSRGDLVFSRTGELLGIMVNNTYCLTIQAFVAAATIPFNQNLTDQHTGSTLSQLYGYVFQLPLRLQ
jgi:hypothetical protein